MECNNEKDSSSVGMNNPFQTLVQIPAEFFATLMTTVKELKQTVDQVQRDNVVLSSEVRGLRASVNKMPGFLRFPALPAEIRGMIVSTLLSLLQLVIYTFVLSTNSQTTLNSIYENKH